MNYKNFFCQNIRGFKLGLNDQATGLCPLHKDRNPSFSVNLKDGLWKCHGGECGQSGNAYQLAKLLGIDAPTEEARPPSLREVARYDYQDEEGKPLFQVRRYEPKTFRQFRFEGGEWVPGMNGVRRVLYNLPKILPSPTVYVVEGEKDVETLRGWGIPATTCPMGAGKWTEEYSAYLAGKAVVIIPDNDEPGKRHAEDVAKKLWGKAKAIKIITLPHGKDLTDWKEGGGFREALKKRVEEAHPLKEPPNPPISSTGKLPLISLKDLLAEPDDKTEYLVEGLLPAGGLSLLAAKPKTGKSTMARQLALSVARGEDFLGRKTEQGIAIYLALEERRSDVRSHFRKMGAKDEEGLKIFAGMAPSDGLAKLRKTAESEKPSLIIVDTLARMARIKDMNDYSQATSGLEPFLALAREVGAHVLLLHHAKKGDGKGIDSILGSTGLAGSVDTIINLHRSDEYRTISTIQRDGNDIPETILTFNKETRTTALGGTKEEAEIDRLKIAIQEYLSKQEGALQEKVIVGEVEGKTGPKRKALRLLVEERKVARSGKGEKGNPYLYENARFLVPDIYGEQGNEHLKTDSTDCDYNKNARSQNLGFFDSCSPAQTTSREREKEGDLPLDPSDPGVPLGGAVYGF